MPRLRVIARSQHGADARQQFARLERLGQVIVCAELQAHDAVHRVALGGEHQYRHLGHSSDASGAHAAAHLQAIHVRQHQVEDDEVRHRAGARLLQPRQAAARIAGMAEPEARLPQVLADHLREPRVVFDHQNVLHGAMLMTGIRPVGRRTADTRRLPPNTVEATVKLGKWLSCKLFLCRCPRA
jgi:hypothetical protein